jgi:hypothetical protein
LGVRRGRTGGKGNRSNKKGYDEGEKRKGGRNRSKRGDCREKDMGIGVSKRRDKTCMDE